jgi:hypothetical protein
MIGLFRLEARDRGELVHSLLELCLHFSGQMGNSVVADQFGPNAVSLRGFQCAGTFFLDFTPLTIRAKARSLSRRSNSTRSGSRARVVSKSSVIFVKPPLVHEERLRGVLHLRSERLGVLAVKVQQVADRGANVILGVRRTLAGLASPRGGQTRGRSLRPGQCPCWMWCWESSNPRKCFRPQLVSRLLAVASTS